MSDHADSIAHFLRPRSIAIIGLAPPDADAPQTHWEIMGMRVLANLRRFGFDPAALHFVSRSQSIDGHRSEEHTSELQSLMRISYAVFCLKKKNHDIHIYIQSSIRQI